MNCQGFTRFKGSSCLGQVPVPHRAVHDSSKYSASIIVSMLHTHPQRTLCMRAVLPRCTLLFTNCLSSSVQCPLHQLGGHGVSHGSSGHHQGNQSHAGHKPPACSDDRSLQSVRTGHHAHRQSEEVSRKT